MGERLVIKVIKEKQAIASLYYQWGAYSATASQLVHELYEHAIRGAENTSIEDLQLRIIHFAEKSTKLGYNPPQDVVNQAIADIKQSITESSMSDAYKSLMTNLFENEFCTHGGISESDMEYVQSKFPNETFLTSNIDRDNGLVDISPEGIEASMRWASGLVIVDVDTKIVQNGVWFVYTIPEYIEELDDKPDSYFIDPNKIHRPPVDIGCYSFDDIEMVADFTKNTSYNWLRYGETIYRIYG